MFIAQASLKQLLFVFQRRGGSLLYFNLELLFAAPLKNKKGDFMAFLL
jgi:hypothetical protein